MKLSASKIDLARRCAWPFRRDAGPRNDSGTYAAAGQDEHAHIEATLRTGDETPRSETHARWLAEFWCVDGQGGPDSWSVERPIALDPRSGETRLGPEGWDRRDYAWAGGWRFICGTPDAYQLCDDESGRRWIRICDWKTGRAAGYADPRDAGQMLFLGLALARHFGADFVRLELVLVNETRLWVERADVPAIDLADFRWALVDLLDAIDASPEPAPGWWCRALYCDYLGRCPATAPALGQAVPAIPLARHPIVLHSGDFVGPEHVGYQWALIRAAEKRLAEAKTAAVMWLKAEPGREAVMPDGSRVAMRETVRESVDAKVAWEPAVREALGAAAEQAITVQASTTKGAIESAAASLAAGWGVSKKAARERVLDQLRAAGVLRETRYESPEETPPPAQMSGASVGDTSGAPSMQPPSPA